eukprot:CAMPEP_0171947694 /NCGR_PEP_ID=MMETSP0993-20121228/61760_1 /TAXON_ID=483369 /ORGANISM="non described non described, Strain CCMP2098" /LENGTH=40 /DNA_ID= /DNA_START= /DNA_END= /DNA_ORIENTATION=
MGTGSGACCACNTSEANERGATDENAGRGTAAVTTAGSSA